MKDFKNKNVLITGGASGIGKLMGKYFLEQGANLIIWDINESLIQLTLTEFNPIGNVTAYKIDISKLDEIQENYEKVIHELGAVDLLINNAGIVVGKYFSDHSLSDIQRTMDINAMAPMYITHLFLQNMIAQNAGYICTISSSAGLISNPKMAVYAASKWAVLGWSDSIRLEMKKMKKNIGVTTVTPYYINTGMFDGVKSSVPILVPEKVVGKIINAIKKDKPIVSMPWSIYFVRFFQGVLPIRFFDWFVGGVLGIYRTMDDFKGR